MDDHVENTRMALRAVKAELIHVQDAMMPYRMRRRAAKDALAKLCVETDVVNQVVRSWRPPSASEIAALDEVNAWAAAGLRDLEPRERALKEAVRMAEIGHERAKRETRKKRGKNAETDLSKSSALTRDPLKRLRNAERVPQSFSANAEGLRNGPKSPQGIAEATTRQGRLF